MDPGKSERRARASFDRRISWGTGSFAQSRLTPFEIYVCQLMAGGMRRGEIARKLRRSPQTISNLLTRSKDKLGARTVAEAIALISGRKRNLA